MCIVYMRVQCSDTLSEVLVGDVEHTELTIEGIVGTALSEFFDTVLIENITVHPSPERTNEDEDLEWLLYIIPAPASTNQHIFRQSSCRSCMD